MYQLRDIVRDERLAVLGVLLMLLALVLLPGCGPKTATPAHVVAADGFDLGLGWPARTEYLLHRVAELEERAAVAEDRLALIEARP